jgi:deazaflavin-dependent oxidoreductase (nitroreductase family)
MDTMSIGSASLSWFFDLHEWVYTRSGGRFGHRMVGVPSLLLRTTGRRSGLPRTNVLTYARDGDAFVLVASKGGADQHPAWFHNITANPNVHLQVATKHFDGRAGIVQPTDPDYARLWKLVNDNNHNRYDGYQAKTSRPIPVVVVAPNL